MGVMLQRLMASMRQCVQDPYGSCDWKAHGHQRREMIAVDVSASGGTFAIDISKVQDGPWSGPHLHDAKGGFTRRNDHKQFHQLSEPMSAQTLHCQKHCNSWYQGQPGVLSAKGIQAHRM